MKKYFPNILTLFNLSFGFFSILYAIEGNLVYGCYFIMFGSVFDFLDGFTARKLQVNSALGKQLDSLADIVTFGVAPAIVVYLLLNDMVYDNVDSEETFWQKLFLIVLIIPLFSAIRLAKFNIDKNQNNDFIGLPTPANALFVASFSAYLSSNQIVSDFIGPIWLIMLIVFLAGLLLLPVRFIALKFKSFKWKGNEFRYVFIFFAVSIIAVCILNDCIVVSISIIILLYILISIITNIVNIKRYEV